MKFHDLANIFPLTEGEEFDALVADIKAQGLREPIVIYQEKILDGRNRYRACMAAGIEWRSVPYTGNERNRRPTLEELNQLMEHFGRVRDHRSSSIPMQKIVPFALFSTRRQEEITLLRWDDLDGDRILVRDMKHPGDKRGNDVYCELPPEALAILNSMPRDGERIFPYSTDAISAAFTRACRILGIEDLRFHDLRHEGISRLFEMGRTIPQVAAVSGHRSWTSLKRYTHIRESADKYENWKWKAIRV